MAFKSLMSTCVGARVGAHIARYMQRKKLTYRDVATLCGTAPSTIHSIVTCSADPSVKVLVQISNALAIPVQKLLS